MKVKKCPARKNCFDYKDNNCDNCNFGNEFTKLHKRIDRLKKQNETLTIQRNAWALTAKALGNKWISVEERLPIGADGKEIAENVIAYTVDGEVATGWVMDDVWWLLYGNNDHHMKHGRGYVTHWMPLPEAPKMKGGAE